MNIDGCAIGAPYRVGNAGLSQQSPCAIGDVKQHQVSLIE
jgi:hypothetical protein